TGLADDDDDFALVVEPLAAGWAHDGTLVGVQRGDWLVKVGRRRWQLGHELLRARVIVQVHSDDLGWLRWREVGGLFDRDAAAVGGNQVLAFANYLNRVAV
ncbi:MAG: hypothetical protein RIR46_1146, partial [Actinomycetota bacterium]